MTLNSLLKGHSKLSGRASYLAHAKSHIKGILTQTKICYVSKMAQYLHIILIHHTLDCKSHVHIIYTSIIEMSYK